MPKIMKNDIRRHMAGMFINTVNSADFSKIQSFLRTFVVGPCMFVAQHEARPEMRLPDKLITAGPRLMSHYLLGCFVQYPDMVMHLKDSSIVTSANCSGSRIVMQIDICATKLHDLEFGDWMPPAAQLGGMYNRAAGAARAAARAGAAPRAKKRRSAMSVTSVSADGIALLPDILGAMPGAEPPLTQGEETKLCVTEPADPCVETVVKTEDLCSKPQRKCARKRRGKKAFDSDADIPEAFVYSLFSKASMIPDPIDLLIRGTITMFLDDACHVQHISLDMKQVDK
jgi:hypothetical protein